MPIYRGNPCWRSISTGRGVGASAKPSVPGEVSRYNFTFFFFPKGRRSANYFLKRLNSISRKWAPSRLRNYLIRRHSSGCWPRYLWRPLGTNSYRRCSHHFRSKTDHFHGACIIRRGNATNYVMTSKKYYASIHGSNKCGPAYLST